jgi:hypothetical protein
MQDYDTRQKKQKSEKLKPRSASPIVNVKKMRFVNVLPLTKKNILTARQVDLKRAKEEALKKRAEEKARIAAAQVEKRRRRLQKTMARKQVNDVADIFQVIKLS